MGFQIAAESTTDVIASEQVSCSWHFVDASFVPCNVFFIFYTTPVSKVQALFLSIIYQTQPTFLKLQA